MVKLVASASLPTRFGKFRVYAFRERRLGGEHLALVSGEVKGREGVLTRVHSQCLTGDALGSLRCDCREQLESALRRIAKNGGGVLVYLRQEGRGIGLANKIMAYRLQEHGLDTVEANRHLGFGDDLREYETAARMLRTLGIKSVRLLTNNPGKVRDLERHGVRVEERIPLAMKPNRHNKRYLRTKRERMNHIL